MEGRLEEGHRPWTKSAEQEQRVLGGESSLARKLHPTLETQHQGKAQVWAQCGMT